MCSSRLTHASFAEHDMGGAQSHTLASIVRCVRGALPFAYRFRRMCVKDATCMPGGFVVTNDVSAMTGAGSAVVRGHLLMTSTGDGRSGKTIYTVVKWTTNRIPSTRTNFLLRRAELLSTLLNKKSCTNVR